MKECDYLQKEPRKRMINREIKRDLKKGTYKQIIADVPLEVIMSDSSENRTSLGSV
jgi:hypothetical protein